jgi:hypothetical protein
LQWAQRGGWRLREGTREMAAGPLSRWVERLRQPGALPLWSTWALGLGLIAYACVVLLQVPGMPEDFHWLCIALLVAGAISLGLRRGMPLLTVEKGGLYVVAALFAYLDTSIDPAVRSIPALDWLIPALLAVITALRLRIAIDRRFELTPLDLLVVFVALVVPSLPGLVQLPAGAAIGIAKIVVLFYALEMFQGAGERLALPLRAGGLLLLAACSLIPVA